MLVHNDVDSPDCGYGGLASYLHMFRDMRSVVRSPSREWLRRVYELNCVEFNSVDAYDCGFAAITSSMRRTLLRS